jgi:hypothetical protein
MALKSRVQLLSLDEEGPGRDSSLCTHTPQSVGLGFSSLRRIYCFNILNLRSST